MALICAFDNTAVRRLKSTFAVLPSSAEAVCRRVVRVGSYLTRPAQALAGLKFLMSDSGSYKSYRETLRSSGVGSKPLIPFLGMQDVLRGLTDVARALCRCASARPHPHRRRQPQLGRQEQHDDQLPQVPQVLRGDPHGVSPLCGCVGAD